MNPKKTLLIFTINYAYINKRQSKKHFVQLIEEIETLSINKQLIKYNSRNDKKSTMKKWLFSKELGLTVLIEYKKSNNNIYNVKLEYSRLENKTNANIIYNK